MRSFFVFTVHFTLDLICVLDLKSKLLSMNTYHRLPCLSHLFYCSYMMISYNASRDDLPKCLKVGHT
jgi:hypothetical protein